MTRHAANVSLTIEPRNVMMPSMLELCFLRHGQTEYSRENRFCGSLDPPLSEMGAKMAEAFARSQASKKWDAVYSSPSQRARQTAAPLGVTPIIDDGLREISYGEWEGLRHEDAEARWPEVYRYWAEDTASRSTPGGETAFAVAARAAPVIERIKREHASGRILVVSHKATIRILVCALLGMDVRLFRDRIAQPVVGLSRFELKKKSGWLLTLLGDVSHLPPELRDAEGT
jgi:probable phosphoglycerate mutase